MLRCEDCDKTFTRQHGLNVHRTFKHPESVPAPPDVEYTPSVEAAVVEANVVSPAPSVLSGLPINPQTGRWNLGLTKRLDLGQGGRAVKMMVPECQTNTKTGFIGCEDPSRIHPGWWRTCEHNPFFTTSEVEETIVDWSDPDAQGVRVKLGERVVTKQHVHPNLRPAHLSVRLNSGLSLSWARQRGWILPEEHPTNPGDPFCQFNGCWSQEIQVRNPKHGDYCDHMQAKIVIADENEDHLEILNQKKRGRQLAGIVVTG